MKNTTTLLPHLFRTEYSKIVAVLCNRYGFNYIEDAEDIVSETFLKAAQHWGTSGVPPNPSAWLYKVAQNKAKDMFRRQKVYTEKVYQHLQKNTPTEAVDQLNLDLSNENILDSQLKMMFVLSNNHLSQEAQICLALKILCGFGVEELATAFLTNKATINKRLYRAKQKIKTLQPDFSLTKPQIKANIDTVLHTLYLLFNEGYFSYKNETTIRKEFCREAMRLALLLTQNPLTNLPKVNALIALMCFHASRLEARIDDHNQTVLFFDQDRSKWNQALIDKGNDYMNLSASGDILTKYHLEAAIAYWHTQAENQEKWEHILQLYNQLLQLEYTPIIALNRTYALSKARSTSIAIQEALKIKLEHLPLYHALLATLYEQQMDKSKALHYLKKGLTLAKGIAKNYYRKRIEVIENEVN